MPLFSNFLQMKWNVKGVNNVLIIKWSFLMQKLLLYFNKKNTRKTSFKKYYTFGRLQSLQRQICEVNRWYVLLESHIPCWKRRTTWLKSIYRQDKKCDTSWFHGKHVSVMVFSFLKMCILFKKCNIVFVS